MREVFADLFHNIKKMHREIVEKKEDVFYIRHQFQYHLQLLKVICSYS